MASRRRVLCGLVGMMAHALALAGASAALLSTAGCALRERRADLQTSPGGVTAEADAWSGRLALNLEAPQGRRVSFSAAFELRGNPDAGELWLGSPLGGTIAQLRWQPGGAALQISRREEQRFDSLRDLMLTLGRALGEPAPVDLSVGASDTASAAPIEASDLQGWLPLTELFGWLRGSAGPSLDSGWQLDDSGRAEGRLSARRHGPEAELRLILDR